MSFLDWLFGSPTEKKTKYKRGEKIKKYAKAARTGDRILCPHCNHDVVVHDFTWMEMSCPNCGATSNKYDWYEAAS